MSFGPEVVYRLSPLANDILVITSAALNSLVSHPYEFVNQKLKCCLPLCRIRMLACRCRSTKQHPPPSVTTPAALRAHACDRPPPMPTGRPASVMPTGRYFFVGGAPLEWSAAMRKRKAVSSADGSASRTDSASAATCIFYIGIADGKSTTRA